MGSKHVNGIQFAYNIWLLATKLTAIGESDNVSITLSNKYEVPLVYSFLPKAFALTYIQIIKVRLRNNTAIGFPPTGNVHIRNSRSIIQRGAANQHGMAFHVAKPGVTEPRTPCDRPSRRSESVVPSTIGGDDSQIKVTFSRKLRNLSISSPGVRTSRRILALIGFCPVRYISLHHPVADLHAWTSKHVGVRISVFVL